LNSTSPVLRALARLYSESKAGRTGAGQRDFLVDLKILLAACDGEDGDERELAIRQLRQQHGRLLTLEGPRRDSDIIHQVRFAIANEAALFALLGETSPTERRQRLARQFAAAAQMDVPERWRAGWKNYCVVLQQAALLGAAMAPFSRDELEANAELLALVPKLLVWHARGGESLLRFASCVLTGSSKRLGELAGEDQSGHRCGKIGLVLEQVTGGQMRSLEDVGILQVPRFVLIHGPLGLLLGGKWLNVGLLQGPCRLSETDLHQATQIACTAKRCLTVENETSFHELAKLNSGELLVCTSYPGSATLTLLQKLPAAMEFWHFGDSDPEGFDILRDLRARSGRPFQSLFMHWRPSAAAPLLDAGNRRLLERLLASPLMKPEHEQLHRLLQAGHKGEFEQEYLGQPTRRTWPFYGP